MDLNALGSQILQELNKFNEIPQRSLDSFIQGVFITFTDDFQKSIENICRFSTPSLESSKYRNSLGPTAIQLQFDTRGSLGLNPTNSNQRGGTPKFDHLQNRFSILSDDEEAIKFDPKSLPDLDMPMTESKTVQYVPEAKKNGTGNFNSHNPSKIVRESFGVVFEKKSSGLKKKKSSGDRSFEHTDEPANTKIGHSQSTKQLSILTNYESAPSKLHPETTKESKKKFHSFLNVSPKNKRTSATGHNRSARDFSTPSPTNQRSTLISKNKSAFDLSTSIDKGKSHGGSFHKMTNEEISKSKTLASPVTLPKSSLGSKKSFKVNPKFESTVNGLRNETLDTVDLTGAGKAFPL